jgi:hypothetical protein
MLMTDKQKIERLLWEIIMLKQLKRSFNTTWRDRKRYDDAILEAQCELCSLGYIDGELLDSVYAC